MANVKSIIINGTAAIIAALFIFGALNMHEVVRLVEYINAHTSTGMAVFYYVVGFAVFFLLPLVGGAAIEVPMWDSKTRIGSEFANAMQNVRNGWVPLIAFGLFGGIVLFFATLGATILIVIAQ